MGRSTLEERFWRKVERRGPDECWPWTAALGGGGDRYGYIRVHGRLISAPRLALILDGRPPGDGRVARHTCDNTICCNPAHLLPGTQGENQDDMARRLRGGRKLEPAQVVEIRARLAAGERQRSIAAAYGVSQPQISKINVGRDWRYAA